MFSGNRLRVLVADDGAENRALAKASLEDEGYEVVLANDGEQAVAAFLAHKPDCALLDIRMPILDGIAACQRIRALPRGADVPMVFVTALRDVETFDRAQLAGADDFLTKPYRPADLVGRVEAAVRLRRLATERGELFAQVRQQRDHLQRLQLQKEQLAAFVVHDLKNPVCSIELLTEVILRDRTGSDTGRRIASQIKDETRALMRMITNLLDISKADEGRLTPRLVTIDLDALVAEVLEAFQARANDSGVSLRARTAAPLLRADLDLLRRILENLVDNAIRYAPEGSAVQLETSTEDGAVLLRVADAGAGIRPEAREQVFERFFQSGGGVESTRNNRGLGLAFCKLAAEAHGGAIWIEDAAPGAAFHVRIPDGR